MLNLCLSRPVDMGKPLYIFFLISVFYTNNCFAQEEMIAHVQKIGVEDGLSSYDVWSTIKASDGVMWFGTAYGLNRYDGASIRYYTKESHGLCHDRIEHVAEDDQGNIWVWGSDFGGERYICVFNPITEEFFSVEEYIQSPPPFEENNTAMFASCQQKVMFTTQVRDTFYYYKWEGKQLEPILQLPNKGTHGPVLEVGQDSFALFRWTFDVSKRKYNQIEYYTDGKLVQEEKCKDGSSFVYQFETNGQSMWTVCLDMSKEEQGIWQLSYIVNGQQTAKVDIKAGWEEQFTYNQGKIYIVGKNILKIYNAADAELLQEIPIELNLLAGEWKLWMDNDGNIWCRNNQHLYHIHLSSQLFDLGLHEQAIPSRTRGIVALDSSRLYVSGTGSFYEGPDDWQLWSSNSEGTQLTEFYLTGAIHDKNNPNLLWWTTEYHGLIAFDLISKRHEFYPFSFSDKHTLLWKPYQDDKNNMWVGAGQGLYRLDLDNKTYIPFGKGKQEDLDELQGSSILHFHPNEKGTWLCTTTGLYLVDLQTEQILQHYSTEKEGKNYFPSNRLAHLYEDEEGIFWVATKGDGLIKWNPETGKYQQFTQYNAGLSHNVLYAVYGDGQGQLWMSSNRGIMSFNKETAFVNIYLEEDGLPHNEFNTIAHAQGNDGRIYFGSQNGVASFYPDDFANKGKNSNFKIIRCFKENTATKEQELLTSELINKHALILRPQDKYIQLEFALLNYKQPSSHQYSYQIIGYDQDWNYQYDNHVRINALPYGTYQLKLRAKASSSNSWIDYPNPIIIHVAKPFYLQWWFIFSMLGLLAAVIFALFKWRTRQLVNRQIELENIVEKRTEKIAKQAEELKVLDKVKSNFFANISHELRTPLTLILGPLSYILDSPEAWKQEKVQEQLMVMQRNGRSLMDLIEEILDLSKLEANKLELQEEATPVRQFFERMFAIFEPQFEAQNLNGKLDFSLADDNISIMLDRKKLEKVINNFLSNAIKFTSKGGEISLGVKEIGNNIEIIVSDNGKGIHPNDLPYIFDRFYQSKQADQKMYGGTGIGLALVQEFAQLMGGKAYAESTLGEGSRFHFCIPKKAAGVSSEWQPTSDLLADEDTLIDIEGDFCVLVVEDNTDMRQFICQLLSEKYEVLSAKDGAEGLEVLEEQHEKIDIVVSDVMMPEVDGLTLLSKIKTHPQWQQIPVVMLTALAAERDKLKALTIGVDDYLTKPFSVVELTVRIQNLLYNAHQRKLASQQLIGENKVNTVIQDNTSKVDASQKEWVDKVEEIILASIKEEEVPTVDLLSKKLFLSERQVQRKMKIATGLTPKKFTQEVQLQMARKILEDGAVLSVGEVAYKSGFEMPITFSRLYKKRFGKLPSSYLK